VVLLTVLYVLHICSVLIVSFCGMFSSAFAIRSLASVLQCILILFLSIRAGFSCFPVTIGFRDLFASGTALEIEVVG